MPGQPGHFRAWVGRPGGIETKIEAIELSEYVILRPTGTDAISARFVMVLVAGHMA